MPADLSVNLNAIAQLRNRRDLPWPSVTGMARIALAAGAHGVTVHPRPDQRHIRFSDLPDLRALLDDEFPHAEFNMEGYPTEEFLSQCEAHAPEQVTLVPDDPAQATSDHGWDFAANEKILATTIARLKKSGFRVALFADPSPNGLDVAKRLGADRIELYTGPYAATYDSLSRQDAALDALELAAKTALELGLGVNAGHDLTVDNLPALAARIPDLAEVSIGHGLTADALIFGMETTVRRYLKACGHKIALNQNH